MIKRKPIKRIKALQGLSREHHSGLLLCFKIRQGIKKKVDSRRILKYVLWFYKNDLVPHFTIEENELFPLLGNEHEMVKKALEDHKIISKLVHSAEENYTDLDNIEKVLEAHIRFEERILFNQMQKDIPIRDLERFKEKHQEKTTCGNWEDEFWL